MSQDKGYGELLDEVMAGKLNRRQVLRRAAVLGLSVPAIGALLAACGSSNNDKTATTSGAGAATQPSGAATSPATSPATAAATEPMASPTEGGVAASPTESATGSPVTGSPSTGEMSIDVAPEVANAADAKQYSGAKLTYYGDGVGIGNQLDKTLAAEFTKATGIDVTVIARPEDSTETYATYQRAFEAKSGEIDVMMIDVIWPGAFAPHLADLTDAFSNSMDQWYDSIVQNNTVGGKFVGAPWFGDFGILYYRKDLLEKYNFDGPPKTWDELEQQSKTIMDGEKASNANFWGFVFQGKAYEGLTCDALEWIASSGGGTIIEDGKVTLDNDNAKAILDKAKGWVGTIAPTGVTGYQEEDARNAFQGGNSAFMRNWPYAYSQGNSEGSAVKGKFDVGPLPAKEGEDHVGTLGGWQLAVSAYSKSPEAAIEFVKYMVSPEVVKWRAVVATFVPLIKTVAEDPEVIKNQPYLENLADVKRVTRPSRETGENYNQVSTEFFQGVNEILTGGNANDIVPTIAQRIERLIG